jgi:8-oxo-dGTP pyrophosphatase MutT (NUDIX family)
MTAADRAGTQTPGGRLVEGTTDPIDATTVLLLRSGQDDRVEVFLLERHIQSDFAGGAYAFPGGKVDQADLEMDPARLAAFDPRWGARLGARSHAHAVGLLVAGVRETFEEAGPLLAHRADGTPVTGDDLVSPSFRDARTRLAARGQPWDWRPWLEAEDLVLDLDALVPFAWWTTPHGMHRRFDTRFVAAAVPASQQDALGHDDVETTDSRWMAPADALDAAARGQAMIIFPTRRILHALSEHDRVDDALTAGRQGAVDLRRILPSLVVRDGQIRVRHPDGGAEESI